MADVIVVKCGKCGAEFEAPSLKAGAQAPCQCGNLVDVPQTPEEPEVPPLSPEEVARKWYYARDGERYGPVALGMLKKLVAGGKLGPHDLAWTKGMRGWKAIGEMDQIHRDLPPRKTPENPSAGSESPPAVDGGAGRPAGPGDSAAGQPDDVPPVPEAVDAVPPELPAPAASPIAVAGDHAPAYGLVHKLAILMVFLGIAGLAAAPIVLVGQIARKEGLASALLPAALCIVVGMMCLGLAQFFLLSRDVARSVFRIEQLLREHQDESSENSQRK
jgi:hypothetical protein